MGGAFSKQQAHERTSVNNSKLNLPKYTEKSYLGGGSSGNVFLAEDADGKKYIVKRFDDPKQGKQEVKILKKIKANCNPHLTCLHKIEKAHGKTYVIIDYVKNSQDLRAFLVNNFLSLNLQHKLLISLTMIQGVAQLHSMGIVHRDIKPDNTIIQVRKQKMNVRLIDYDLARYKSDFPSVSLAGTRRYIDPYIYSRFVQKKKVSFGDWKRADIYSLALTLFELCFGLEFWYDKSRGWLTKFLAKANDRTQRTLQEQLQTITQQALDAYKKNLPQAEETVNIFIPLISEMISYPPKKRPSLQSIYEYIENAIQVV